MNRKVVSLVMLVLVVAMASSLTLFAKPPAPCQHDNGGCLATINTAVYTGGPPYPVCLIGVPLVRVDVSIACKNGSGGSTSAVRCGILNNPVTLSFGGRTHLIAPDSGNDWEDTLTDCNALIYKVN